MLSAAGKRPEPRSGSAAVDQHALRYTGLMEQAEADAAIIFATVPDRAAGDRIARALVEARLAACVQVMPECSSTYVWEGKQTTEAEYPMLIKTTVACASAAVAALVSLHPYDVPEAVVVHANGGHAPYLDWIRASCSKPEA